MSCELLNKWFLLTDNENSQVFSPRSCEMDLNKITRLIVVWRYIFQLRFEIKEIIGILRTMKSEFRNSVLVHYFGKNLNVHIFRPLCKKGEFFPINALFWRFLCRSRENAFGTKNITQVSKCLSLVRFQKGLKSVK